MAIHKRFRAQVIGCLSKITPAFIAAMILLSIGDSKPVYAQAGDLIVAPTRVVLEGRTRSAELVLSNTGSASATYRISLVNMRMTESGSVTQITEPDEGQQFADKLLRYSPRQITLAPGSTQAVRVLLRKPKDLAEGEYRSHIFFRGVPDEGGQSVNQVETTNGIQIRLIPVYGITLPIIVRHGNLDYSASLSDLKVIPATAERPSPSFEFLISREGTSSAFGNFTITHTSGSGEKTIIGEIQRLAVYTPNKSRRVNVTLRVPDGVKLSEGQINLAFRATEGDGGKLIADAEMKLP